MNSDTSQGITATHRSDPFASPGAQAQPTWDEKLRRSSALIPVLALLVLALLGLAGTLVARQVDRPAPTVLGATAPDDGTPPVMSPQAQAQLAAPRAPVKSTSAPAPITRPAAPAPVAAAPVCQSCGVVESVVAVKRQGQGSGMGAVAGGVVGGLLGSQVGGGSGRTAATIVGAVGGGFAGNAIEKNYKASTVYQVRVRMNDGSVRTVEQTHAPATGSRVVVEGNSLRAA